MNTTDIIEVLRQKIAVPTGRHLYGVLGTYARLDAFAKHLCQAKSLRGIPFSPPLNCYAKGISEEISTRSAKWGGIPVLVSYSCLNGCKPATETRRHNDEDPKKREYVETYDLGKIREIEEKEIPYWYPKHRMMHVESETAPWGDEWRQGRNFRTVAALFTKRNLWALAILKHGIEHFSDEKKVSTSFPL